MKKQNWLKSGKERKQKGEILSLALSYHFEFAYQESKEFPSGDDLIASLEKEAALDLLDVGCVFHPLTYQRGRNQTRTPSS